MVTKFFLFFSISTACIIFDIGIAKAYDNTNFKGSYAFRLVGPSSIVLANEPRTVATGLISSDGSGHVSGHGTFRSAGVSCVVQISGTYSIKSDGTGLLSSIARTSTPGCFTSALDLAIVLSDKGETF